MFGDAQASKHLQHEEGVLSKTTFTGMIFQPPDRKHKTDAALERSPGQSLQ
jgi:hypothetical protein